MFFQAAFSIHTARYLETWDIPNLYFVLTIGKPDPFIFDGTRGERKRLSTKPSQAKPSLMVVLYNMFIQSVNLSNLITHVLHGLTKSIMSAVCPKLPLSGGLEMHNLPLNVKMYPTTVLLQGRVCISDTFTYPVDTTVTFGLSYK